MTPKEKRAKIKELESNYLLQVNQLTKEYKVKVQQLILAAEEQKIQRLRKQLGTF